MKYFQILLVILIIGCNSEKTKVITPESKQSINLENGNNQIEYDLNTDSIGFDSPEKVAKQVIEFLQTRDTSKYLDTAIPLKAQKYLFAKNFEYRPDITNQDNFMKWLDSRFEKRMNNFLVRAGYISEIMIDDKGFDITKATIDTITIEDVRIKNYGGFNRFIVGEWADITIKMNYNNKDFFFEVPQIIKLKDKWFLYYPEYYIRTKRELEFTNKRVQEINKQADDFWL
ncbi:MAG: hypothetical protein AB8F94_01815 [Saprospiraceae bacterium]